jgi:hypothetical protein
VRQLSWAAHSYRGSPITHRPTKQGRTPRGHRISRTTRRLRTRAGPDGTTASRYKGQVGALPFLEYALFKLWEMRDGRRLTAKAYMEMGRLAGALEGHAEEFSRKL